MCDITAHNNKGIEDVHIVLNDDRPLRIWQMPDCLKVSNRYVVSARIGAATEPNEYSVITVIDRFGMIMRGLSDGKIKVVAQWRGHQEMDVVVWKAAQLGKLYDDAWLVFITNEVDASGKTHIIDDVANVYPNIFIRAREIDLLNNRYKVTFGFKIDSYTKKRVVDCYKQLVDAELLVNPYGMSGQAPELSAAVGLYISNLMPIPFFKKHMDCKELELANMRRLTMLDGKLRRTPIEELKSCHSKDIVSFCERASEMLHIELTSVRFCYFASVYTTLSEEERTRVSL